MKEEIVLKSGWIKIDKKELDKLRKDMRSRYEQEGGSKNFNSHLPNYNELISFIRARLNEMQEGNGTSISVEGQLGGDLVPGKTFFKDLFYTKKDADNPQFQEYNIEICYLYTYGKTRLKHLREGKSIEVPTFSVPESKSTMKVIVSSTMNNMTEAEKIRARLEDDFGLTVESDTRNTKIYSKGTLEELYSNIDKDTYIFTLISRDYLQNENCVKELIDFTKNNLEIYLRHTLHIMLSDIYQGDFNIFDTVGRSELLKYWKLRIEQLEENHKLILGGKKERGFYKKLREELDEIKMIIEELHRVLDLIRESNSSVLYEIFFSRIRNHDELKHIMPGQQNIHDINDYLETTYKRIKIPSNNDPNKPEFPPEPFYTPEFPASDTYRIRVPGFKNVWLKDESTNPTGTHKDRFAWEVVIKYKSLIEGLKYKKEDSLPQMSMISSGSAAIAIQHLFNLFKIPTKLKVLVDYELDPDIKSEIEKIGCEMYEYDLSERLLTSDDIKELTENKKGIDITYREVLDPTHDNYYDWMSYEIINEKPDYCFIPFGTGDLFINVLNIVKIEYFYSFVSKHDPRFLGNIKSLKKCNFMGASSKNPETQLDKLFSNFLPSIDSFRKYIRELKDEYGCVGKMTNIYYVEEKYVEEALEVAEKQDLTFEPSGMAGLALLMQMKDKIPNDSNILIVNTGKTKKISELEIIDSMQNA